MAQPRQWWKEAVIYQIYPKSFQDSNGDGVGDLAGIRARLDMLSTLGVDALWLTPFFASPDVDNGYDISDYRAVGPQYGTLADLEDLLEAAHRLGMKILLDLVINHTSDQHEWFVESRKSKDNPYRNFYIWRDGKSGREPNNWGAHFSPSAWTFDALTGQYYLHTFSPQQPDLNWENPAMRRALYDMIRWWLEKGVDGFRLDAISFIAKTPGLPDNPGQGRYIFDRRYMMNGPRLHEYLREMNQQALRGYNVVTVGECTGLTLQDAIDLSNPERQELNMPFLFEPLKAYNTYGKCPERLKEILTRWQTGLHGRGWSALTFNNHDNPRVVSLFGDDAQYRVESARALATLLLTLEGTPVLYQGEEIGMTNAVYERIEDYDDVQALNAYRQSVAEGGDPQAALEHVRRTSRDRARSPYQWSAAPNAGFTTGKPWLGVNPNYTQINLEQDMAAPGSIFQHYRRLIALRKRTPALVYGQYIPRPAPEDVLIYQRVWEGVTIEVAVNLSAQTVPYKGQGELLLSSPEQLGRGVLGPYEARIYRRGG